MLLPVLVFAFRVFVPVRRRAWKAEDENVIPAVLVEVVAEREKVVRVTVLLAEPAVETGYGHLGHRPELEFERCGTARRLALVGRVVLVALLEVWPGPPIRTGDDVQFSVLVEVAEICAFAPELVAE